MATATRTELDELPFPAEPPKPAPRPRYPEHRERIVEVRRDDGILGEHLDAERTTSGNVVLRHTIPGRSVDSACLTSEEAAALCAFLLRTLRPSGARFEITEAGRRALRGGIVSATTVPQALASLTAYVQEDIAMGLELAAVACDRESDRMAVLRGASLIRQLPVVRACRKCLERPASVERGDSLCDECFAGEDRHA